MAVWIPVGRQMKHYYDHGGITIYCGDARDVVGSISADIAITDPPYGIRYQSGRATTVSSSIVGDETTELRDWFIGNWLPRPLATFATWRCRPPSRPRGCLVWSKAVGGMGDLQFPWQQDFEMIWIYGKGWNGYRGSAVLRAKTVVTWNTGPCARQHPHEKPDDLLTQIIAKAPPGVILDPFMGIGATLVGAKMMGREAIGIEIEERYCEIAAKRLAQEVLF